MMKVSFVLISIVNLYLVSASNERRFGHNEDVIRMRTHDKVIGNRYVKIEDNVQQTDTGIEEMKRKIDHLYNKEMSKQADALEHSRFLMTLQGHVQRQQEKRIQRLENLLKSQEQEMNLYTERLSHLEESQRMFREKCNCLYLDRTEGAEHTDADTDRTTDPNDITADNVTDTITKGTPWNQMEHNDYNASASIRNARAVPDQHVAFSAYLDSQINRVEEHAIIKMAAVILNEGNAYSSTTGIFNAPVDGVFLFSFSIEFVLAEKLWVNLMVDGKAMSSVMANPNHLNQNTHVTNMAVVRLTSGQSVWLGVGTHADRVEDRITWGSSYRSSTFNGVLLYP